MSTVTRTALLEAPIEEVWSAVTDPDALAAWLASSVSLDVRPGGVGRLSLPDGDRSVLVTAVEEGRHLSMLWWGDDDVVSAVDFTLVPTPSGTSLTVVERLATPTASARWGCAFALLATLVVPVRA
ncbi:MAG: SRPBCC domain-containing protein [Acidimicrobiales bacterium]